MFLKSMFWQMVNTVIKICLELFVFNRKIRRILKGNWAKFYLRKYVKYGVKNPNYLTKKNIEDSQIIWQYWESPDGSIPPLVQACLNSVDKFRGSRKRILLNPDNIKEYVDIPEIFWELRKKGFIKTAFFSDILRTCLLLQHGGLWMDATVLLTEELPENIFKLDLFVFQNDLKIDLDGLNMASYFLAAKAGNNILAETLSAMEAYWKENRFLVNYFTFLHAFTMVTQATKENKEIFEKLPFFSYLPVQRFQSELLKPFEEKRWEQIKKISGVHKLTHKQSVLTKDKNFSIEGTFYEHIIKEFC